MICFAWNAFLQYAARFVGAFVRSVSQPVVVVATLPSVPIRGMEEICGCDLIWIERNENHSIAELVGEIHRCIFLGGWNLKPFARFCDPERSNGDTAAVMCDSNWALPPFLPLSFHWWRVFALECDKALRLRLPYRGKYDAVFVLGKFDVRLLLGNCVGAALDMLVADQTGYGFVHGRMFDPRNAQGIKKAFLRVMQMSDTELTAASAASLSAAKTSSVGKFVDAACVLTGIRTCSNLHRGAVRSSSSNAKDFA